jgi:hypothetical protein
MSWLRDRAAGDNVVVAEVRGAETMQDDCCKVKPYKKSLR